jgi:hypothetical protein
VRSNTVFLGTPAALLRLEDPGPPFKALTPSSKRKMTTNSDLSVAGLSRLILHVEPAQLLHALAGIDLGGKDVALSIDGDIVERRELADLPPRPTETV